MKGQRGPKAFELKSFWKKHADNDKFLFCTMKKPVFLDVFSEKT